MSAQPSSEPDWVHGHPHEPNLAPPSADPTLTVLLPGGGKKILNVADLAHLPQQAVAGCYIVSTGHGRSGPFQFAGVTLSALLTALAVDARAVQHIDVVAADGFGARLVPSDLEDRPGWRPPLLALRLDDQPLARTQGLVRLITPDEIGDALRQVKWVSQVIITGNIHC